MPRRAAARGPVFDIPRVVSAVMADDFVPYMFFFP
jgi:hypothetical protein